MTPTEKLKRISENLDLQAISSVVLNDPRFPLWSGSSEPNKHHYGKGGLSQHVLEVVELALRNNEYFTPIGKGVDTNHLFLAAIFHDAGKMYDYSSKNVSHTEWEATPHKRFIHHISRSALIWNEAKLQYSYYDPNDDILHAILSHHGRREWGSPVSPGTRLAWMLHLSDYMSAAIDDYNHREIK